MSERKAPSKKSLPIFIGLALVCLVNAGLGVYFVAKAGAFWIAPMSDSAGMLFVLSFGLLLVLIFRKERLSPIATGSLLLAMVLMSYRTWSGAFEQRRDYADIRLAVSEICDQGNPQTDETRTYCRRFVVKAGGYLCNVSETPMTRCEIELRKVSRRPDNLDRSAAEII
jgi:hypothetical protein